MSKKNQISKKRGMRRQLQAQNKKIKSDVYKTIIRIVKACDAYNEFQQLSEKDIGLMRRVPFKKVVVVSDQINIVKTSVLTKSRKEFLKSIHTSKVKLRNSKEEFSLFDIVTAGFTLWFHALKRDDDEKWLLLYDKLAPLWVYFRSGTDKFIFNLIANVLQKKIEMYSHYDGFFYWLTWKTGIVDYSCGTILTIHKEKCFRKKIVINEIGRPVFRVGYSVQQDGLQWVNIKGDRLYHLNSWINKKREYPIFVQSHALRRLKERLFPIRFYERLLYLSLIEPDVSKGPGDKIFLTLKHEDCKLGYLLCKFTGSELVIVSFLFITNSGTKEGAKFNEQLHLKAYSKNYFKLDLLSTYINTNICNDPFFSKILKKCGCNDLVKYKNHFEDEADTMFAGNLKRELAIEKMVG